MNNPHTILLTAVIMTSMTTWVAAQRGGDTTSDSTSVQTKATAGIESVEYLYPVISDFGKVVKLPSAAQQPREGSRICVDVTGGGDAAQLNPSLEKIARFVNIYGGAGEKPVKSIIAVVLHGDATLTILTSDAYEKKFGVRDNPNLDCLRALHQAGVKFYVCGQSLIGKGGSPEDVVSDVETAVSALTAIVNLQTDGYAYVPLGK